MTSSLAPEEEKQTDKFRKYGGQKVQTSVLTHFEILIFSAVMVILFSFFFCDGYTEPTKKKNWFTSNYAQDRTTSMDMEDLKDVN